jgi:hypothetical protein
MEFTCGYKDFIKMTDQKGIQLAGLRPPVADKCKSEKRKAKSEGGIAVR